MLKAKNGHHPSNGASVAEVDVSGEENGKKKHHKKKKSKHQDRIVSKLSI